jgi:2-dehydropantoate 2-reductase
MNLLNHGTLYQKYIRRLAQKHGMPTPANDFFYEKIREIEANYNK